MLGITSLDISAGLFSRGSVFLLGQLRKAGKAPPPSPCSVRTHYLESRKKLNREKNVVSLSETLDPVKTISSRQKQQDT